MKQVVRYGFAALAVLALAGPGQTRAPSKAEAVVAASKRASGGSAWDRPQGCYEEGTHADGAIAYKTWFSLRRYGMRVESRRGGSTRLMGFNGEASWRSEASGTVDVRSDSETLKEAIVTAYLSNNGFFFPKRFPAAFKYVREAAEGGRTFDVVEITPKGGRPIETWFDRSTHFLARVVDSQGRPPVQVEAGDYRRVGKLAVAFSLTVTGPDGQALDRGAVTSLRCGPMDASLFGPPRAY